jgi:HSP90 family molecular chaperone
MTPVLYFDEPIDEYVMQNVRDFEGKTLQNVAKEGLKFGDEDEEETKEKQKDMETKFAPLADYLKIILSQSYVPYLRHLNHD